ncbi:MAG: hypothetical protein KGJ23_09930 [Euryarchaeota archaeon]|nr:hypothetical protein [Euryarchaeota archaeon]MDE1836922.1 hypothetical protein [Euryarchaeota archaeon]MDE1881526.1 hypothetical protein [Euryarchaeota archaeon]MDE2045093.1 hypothetical protein [Thermoplasmata archaeon]
MERITGRIHAVTAAGPGVLREAQVVIPDTPPPPPRRPRRRSGDDVGGLLLDLALVGIAASTIGAVAANAAQPRDVRWE